MLITYKSEDAVWRRTQVHLYAFSAFLWYHFVSTFCRAFSRKKCAALQVSKSHFYPSLRLYLLKEISRASVSDASASTCVTQTYACAAAAWEFDEKTEGQLAGRRCSV